VLRTRVGYTGGSSPKPTYHAMGDHSETVELDYDPTATSYGDLLAMFWKNHDPTSNCTRQYMSAIFYHDEEQKRMAEETMAAAVAKGKKIKTLILPMKAFYNAEGYHQKYLLQRHPWLLQALDIDPEDELIESHVAARLNGFVGGYGKVKDFDDEWEKMGLNNKMAEYVKTQMANNKR
jgi:peptide-methionine (S)-S-oxide reductase